MNFKSNFLGLFALLVSLPVFGQQNFNYHSSYHIPASNGTSGWPVFAPSGQYFSTGMFSGTTDFQPGAGAVTLTTTYPFETYFAKYAANDSCLFAKKLAAANANSFIGIGNAQIDAAGNLIISGSLWGTIDMDPGSGTFWMSDNGTAGGTSVDDDGFIAKYDANGNFLWAFVIGYNCPGCTIEPGEYVQDHVLDAAGNIYALGVYLATCDFDPGPGVVNLPWNAGDGVNIYLVKYSPTGTYLGGLSFGGASHDEPIDLLLGNDGFLYASGGFRGTSDFDPGPGTTSFTSAGETDYFLAKYSTALAFQWAFAGGNETHNALGRLGMDAAGNIYTNSNIKGNFSATDFDPGTGTFMVQNTTPNDNDALLLKYSSAGAFIWGKILASPAHEAASFMAIDNVGNAWYKLFFYDDLDIDPGAGSTVLAADFNGDALAKYTPAGDYAGEVLNFTPAPGTGEINWLNWGIFTDAGNTMRVALRIKQTIDVDPGAGVHNHTSSQNNLGEWVMVKLTKTAAPPPPPPVCGVPQNLRETAVASNTATLRWRDMGATQYSVQWKQNGLAWNTILTTDTFLTINNLTAFKAHSWRIRAKCGTVWTAYSPTRTFTTPQTGSTCTSPTEVDILNVTASSALVDWPAYAGATSYQVGRRAVGTTAWTTLTLTADQLLLSNLMPSTSYQIRLRTKCGTTWFPYSPIYTFTTPALFSGADDRDILGENPDPRFGLQLFPNPARDVVNVRFFAADELPENARLAVFDAAGRLVFEDFWETEPGENGYVLQVADWPKGVFVVKVLVGEKVETRQLAIF